MEISTIWTSVITTIGTVVVILLPLAVPTIRMAAGNWIAGLVKHHFDQRLERLKSELRQSEEEFRAEPRANENRLNLLTESALSLRSSRQAALDARRLQATEKVWAAKIATDRWKMAAKLVSKLNVEEIFKAARDGDSRVEQFAGALDKLARVDLEKEAPLASAVSERPFLPANVWTLFSAYQGVIIHAVMVLKVLSTGAAHYWKDKDTQKPLMLLALPEYRTYIEQYGQSGYYDLLGVLEQKLLNAIVETLDGKAVDVAKMKRNTEIISAAQELSAGIDRKIPDEFRRPDVPPPDI